MTIQPEESAPESILIVDFGSQVTQLIARRVREAGVYSEIAPFNAALEAFHRMQPKGIILSGSPASVTDPDGPRIPQEILDNLPQEQRLRLPMRPENRSLNLANTAAIVVYEAWRQHELPVEKV